MIVAVWRVGVLLALQAAWFDGMVVVLTTIRKEKSDVPGRKSTDGKSGEFF
jgi:hypothetical protein